MKGGTKAIIITVSSICLMSTGCATAPTAQQYAQADYGEYPVDYREIVKNYHCDHSPFSRSSNSTWPAYPYYHSHKWLKEPYKGYFVWFGQFTFGYIVDVGITLRSRTDWSYSFGYKERAIMIKNGKVVGSQSKNDSDLCGFIPSYGKSAILFPLN